MFRDISTKPTLDKPKVPNLRNESRYTLKDHKRELDTIKELKESDNPDYTGENPRIKAVIAKRKEQLTNDDNFKHKLLAYLSKKARRK